MSERRGVWTEIESLLSGLAITFISMFRPRVTIQYPHVPVPVSPIFRGPVRLIIDEETNAHKCVACLACQRICPTHAIPVLTITKNDQNKNVPVDFVIDDALCCYCGLCVDVCPTLALEHTSLSDAVTTDPSLLKRMILHDGYITPDNDPVHRELVPD